jgi:hypothetical protein
MDYTSGYVTYNSITNEIVVAFMGSKGVPKGVDPGSLASFLNWETNLDFVKVPYYDIAGASVHQGFFSSYNHVQAEIIADVLALIK